MEVGSLWVRLGLDDIEFSQGLKRAGASLEATGKKLNGIGTKLSLGVTAPLLAAGGAATKMAMDAVESENLFEVSMGRMADAARKWSEGLSDSLGLNEYELRRNVGMLDTMFQSMKFGEQAAFDMASGLTELAYDMASFYNLRPDEAFEKLRAGITGEIEPLKRLGILVDENTVKTYAYTHGIAKQGAELTEQQKVMARYGSILEQTSDAQGDLARTLDSPTNKLRVLQSRIQELGISIGQYMIPAVDAAVTKVGAVVKWFGDLDDGTQKLILTVVGFTAAMGPVLIVLGQTAQAIAAIGTAATVMTGPVGLTVAAIAALAVGAAAYKVKSQMATAEMERQRKEAERLAEQQYKENGQVVELAGQYENLQKKLAGTAKGTDEYKRLSAELNSTKDALAKLMPGVVSAYDAEGKAIDIDTGKLRQNAQAAEAAMKARQAQVLSDTLAQMHEAQAAFRQFQAEAERRAAMGMPILQSEYQRQLHALGQAVKQAQDHYATVQNSVLGLAKTAEEAGARTSTAGANAASGLGAAMAGMSGAASKTASDVKTAFEQVMSSLTTQSDILKAKYELTVTTLGETATEAQKLTAQMDFQKQELELVTAQVTSLQFEYDKLKATKGANAEETQKLYLELLREQAVQAGLEQQIKATTEALKQQAAAGRSFRSLLGSSNADEVYSGALGLALEAAIGSTGKGYDQLSNADIANWASSAPKITLPQFDNGGIVPGPMGRPTLAVVHGGEEVLTREQRRGTPIINNYTFAPGSIVIPAKDLAEMRTIQDFFTRLRQASRSGPVPQP